jgi:uncharacterized membrane protein
MIAQLLTIHSIVVVIAGSTLLLGLVLLRQTTGRMTLPGCGPQSACAAITKSRWGRWGSLPVAMPGVLLYALMFLAAVLTHPVLRPLVPAKSQVWLVTGLLATVLADTAAGAWFIALQAIVIRRFCRYCTMAHLLVFVLVGLLLFGKVVPLTHLATAGLIATALVALLIAGQVFIRPKIFEITTPISESNLASCPSEVIASHTPISSRGSDSHLSALEIQHTPAPPVSQPRKVVLAGGNFRASLEEWPLLGHPSAAHIFGLLFDYTCLTCREMHRVVAQAVREASPELAVLCIPVPQSPACNNMFRGFGDRDNACTYTRIALCLNQAAPDQYSSYVNWLMEPAQIPPAQKAFCHALEVAPAMKKLWPPGPRIDIQIRAAIAAYTAAKVKQVPTLLLPRTAITGLVPTAKQLLQILKHEIGLPEFEHREPAVFAPSILWGGGGMPIRGASLPLKQPMAQR